MASARHWEVRRINATQEPEGGEVETAFGHYQKARPGQRPGESVSDYSTVVLTAATSRLSQVINFAFKHILYHQTVHTINIIEYSVR